MSHYKPVSIAKRTTFPHNALWSSPRSGNHWVRFIVEYLTGHPTCGTHADPKDRPIFTDRFPSAFHPLIHVSDKHPYVLYKSHRSYPLLNNSTAYLSQHPQKRRWSTLHSGLNFNFYQEREAKREYSTVKEYTQFFHQLLAKPEYQQVKPYIARYM